jgi:hypothetical protein
MTDGELYKLTLSGNTYIYAYKDMQDGNKTWVYVCVKTEDSTVYRSVGTSFKKITSSSVANPVLADDRDKEAFFTALRNQGYHYSIANKKLFFNGGIIL